MAKMKLPKGIETPSVADFAGMGEVTLLNSGAKLNNLLNHLADLKGTPFEEAFSYLSEKFPHVLGNVRRITSESKTMPFTRMGEFQTNPAHARAGVARKGLPVGDIRLNSDSSGKLFGADPVEALAHESTHAAQALGKGPQRFDALYEVETKRAGGYDPNKYEISARQVGRKQKKLSRRAPKK